MTEFCERIEPAPTTDGCKDIKSKIAFREGVDVLDVEGQLCFKSHGQFGWCHTDPVCDLLKVLILPPKSVINLCAERGQVRVGLLHEELHRHHEEGLLLPERGSSVTQQTFF